MVRRLKWNYQEWLSNFIWDWAQSWCVSMHVPQSYATHIARDGKRERDVEGAVDPPVGPSPGRGGLRQQRQRPGRWRQHGGAQGEAPWCTVGKGPTPRERPGSISAAPVRSSMEEKKYAQMHSSSDINLGISWRGGGGQKDNFKEISVSIFSFQKHLLPFGA